MVKKITDKSFKIFEIHPLVINQGSLIRQLASYSDPL